MAITVFVTSLVAFVLTPGSLVKKPLAAFIAAGITLAVDPIIYQRSLKKTLREVCREQMGTDEPFKVKVEMTESGIRFEQMNARSIIDWAIVKEIEETGDAIYFYVRDADCFAVRKRAFDSTESKEHFVKRARHYMDSSQRSSSIA